MMEYMPHSGRKPHIWKFRTAWYRQLLIAHGWGLRGAYASKSFGGHEYMMTKLREEGPFRVCLIRRKDDFWADISRERRDEVARNTRRSFHLAGQDSKNKMLAVSREGDKPNQEKPIFNQTVCLPTQTLEEIRAKIREEYPGITDAELESWGC